MFRGESDFLAFDRVMRQAQERFPIRILCFCVMPNHWHFVVWPKEDGEVTDFFRWLTHTHAMRWRVSHRNVGHGHVYQGRFKSFPVQEDGHFLTLCRYVERNAAAAGLCKRAEQWRWGSAWIRLHGDAKQRAILSSWPVKCPGNWNRVLNVPLQDPETLNINTSMRRGRPLGDADWMAKTVFRLRLDHTVRSEGRPKKVQTEAN